MNTPTVQKTIWFCDQRFSAYMQRCPDWRDGFRFYFHENGGRGPNECLDIGVNVGEWAFSFTVWRIGSLTRFLSMFPAGSGYSFGWMPQG